MSIKKRGGFSSKPHGVHHNLDARRAAWDMLPQDTGVSGKPSKRNTTRPGSTNRKKQG